MCAAGGSLARGASPASMSMWPSSTGFRLPLTTRPTLDPLDPGRMIRDICGLAFFSSRVVVVPAALVAPALVAFAAAVLGKTFSLALLLGSSPFAALGWTGWPDAV